MNSKNVLTTSEVRSEKQSGLASASLRKSAIEKKRLIVEGHVTLVLLGQRKLMRKKQD